MVGKKMHLYEVTIRSVIDDDSVEENYEYHVETHEAFSPKDAGFMAMENWKESCYPNYDPEVVQINQVLFQKYPGDSDENEPYPKSLDLDYENDNEYEGE